jgi:hypothetical protein
MIRVTYITFQEEADSDAFHEIELAMEASFFPNSYPSSSTLIPMLPVTSAMPNEPAILSKQPEGMAAVMAPVNPFISLSLPKTSLVFDIAKLSLLANMNDSLVIKNCHLFKN